MNRKKKQKNLITIGGIIVGIVMVVMIIGKENIVTPVRAESVTIYKSPTCGCCGNYTIYMKREGYDVHVVDTEDMESIKQQYGIPADMESCHTTVINNGEYVIEGHIPVEGIERVIADESNTVHTIAMPGMPVGSPGMPGRQQEPFNIFRIGEDGSVDEYMSL